MTSKVTVQEVGKFEELKLKTYLEIKKFNSKLLEKLEEQGMDKYSFPFENSPLFMIPCNNNYLGL